MKKTRKTVSNAAYHGDTETRRKTIKTLCLRVSVVNYYNRCLLEERNNA